MLAIVKWEGTIANVFEYFNKESLVIDGGFIGANTITANHIAANTITATEVQAGSLSADRFAADLAFISELTISPFYAETNTPTDLTNYSRLVLAGRPTTDEDDMVTRPAGIFGYYDAAGDNSEAAIEQFRFDSDDGQIIMSHGYTGGRTVLDGDGLTVKDNSNPSRNALQIIGTISANRNYEELIGDGSGNINDSIGTMIIGDSMNSEPMNMGILINKHRLAFLNNLGIQFFAPAADRIRIINQNPSSADLIGTRGRIFYNTSPSELKIEFHPDDISGATSGINLSDGMITFTGMVSLGDTTADFENIETNILRATTNTDMRNIGSTSREWNDIFISGDVKNTDGNRKYSTIPNDSI